MMKRNLMTTHICSSQTAFYHELQQRFLALLQEHSLLGEQVSLSAKMLSPEEAIGIPKRKDFPILSGKDIMVQAASGRPLQTLRPYFTERWKRSVHWI